MLDNVLDVTVWPLPQQEQEAQNKRRIGLGFTGLGDALVMLGLRYDSDEARAMAAQIAETMRDAAYVSSVDLAREKGEFPLLDTEKYLAAPRFASRLPEEIKAQIRKHGIRNSHLLSIAPTGTISLAFADNASQRHRAGLRVDLSAQKAHAGRHAQNLRCGRSCLASVSSSGR